MSQRPTKRDRREAAKQQRLEAERRSKKQRRKRWGYGGIGAAAIVALVVALILSSGGSGKIDIAKLNRLTAAAGCSSLTTVPDQGRGHVPQGQIVQYNSIPPTSGSHWAVTGVAPAPTGVHTSPIADEAQVHNLEHGHIGVQYAQALNSSVRDALESFTRTHDTLTFMAPRTDMPAGTVLAFTRWDQKITCANPTDPAAIVAALREFYDDYAGDGPEGDIPGTPL